MQSSAMRSDAVAGFPIEPGRRSASGASTNSHDSAMTTGMVFNNDARYAPIRPMSQPMGQSTQENFPIAVQSFEQEHGSIQQLHQYNNGQHPVMHPQVAAFQNQPQHFGPYEGMLPFHAMSEDPSESRPGSGHRRASLAPSLAPGGGATGTDGEVRAKKNASTNAANERELRELIETNAGRSLESIAKDVRSAERTHKAERAKQLFAMRWLREYCRHDRESVPRNRVYTYYTQRCGSERVDTLNPASFGKLVRVIFPGIATRRLGVRGESKYHYVNLSLADDPAARGAAPPPQPSATHTAIRPAGGSANVDARMAGQPATGVDQSTISDPSAMSFFNSLSDTTSFDPHHAASAEMTLDQQPTNPPTKGFLFAEPSSQAFKHDQPGPQIYTQQLRFTSPPATTNANGALIIPDIKPFLPPRADPDLGENLEALYRTHCTSLIDAVRYVKEKSFNRLLGAFNGQMTVPVAKLFQHPNLAPWIKQCDTIMYQQVIRFVSQLALQVMPPQVFTMMKNLSGNLSKQIRMGSRNYPDHVLHAKLEPARVFCSLLQRLLRVNESTHAAANILTSDVMRAMMWQEWARSVKPKRVIESELPDCGWEETYNILTKEVRLLLEPIHVTDHVDVGVDFEEQAAIISGRLEAPMAEISAESLVERWALFLRSIPTKFPNVPTRGLLHYINAVGTAALRDLTVEQSQAFGGWWITKVWIDEMMLWQAEMGGFLDERPIATPQIDGSRDGVDGIREQTGISGNDTDRPGTTRSHSANALGLDFNTMPNLEPTTLPDRPATGPPTATFRFTGSKLQQKHENLTFDFDDPHEDSGIGLSLLDDRPHSNQNFHSNHISQDDLAGLLQ